MKEEPIDIKAEEGETGMCDIMGCKNEAFNIVSGLCSEHLTEQGRLLLEDLGVIIV